MDLVETKKPGTKITITNGFRSRKHSYIQVGTEGVIVCQAAENVYRCDLWVERPGNIGLQRVRVAVLVSDFIESLQPK